MTSHDHKAFPFKFAARMSHMKSSAVRELLKVAQRPDILSFAGGLPAPDLFPVQDIARAYAETLAEEGPIALQYGTTEGHPALREWICKRLNSRGVPASVDEIIITSGAQQGIDLVARALLDPWDTVALGNPSYLAALQVFAGYEAKFLAVPSDDEGMCIDKVQRQIVEKRPKMIYVVPNFHNPTGITMSLRRRKELVSLAREFRIPILEDDPYGELRFRGEFLPPLASMQEAWGVIQLGTFSKTLSPGMRIGWVYAPAEIIKQVAIAKQAADLHTSTINQRAASRLLSFFDYDANLLRLRKAYGERADAMRAALTRYMPEGTTWTDPDGGLFFWLKLPAGLQSAAIFPKALEKKVAFVPGDSFFAGEPDLSCMRLNYSACTPEKIEEGMKRLGELVKQELAAKK